MTGVVIQVAWIFFPKCRKGAYTTYSPQLVPALVRILNVSCHYFYELKLDAATSNE